MSVHIGCKYYFAFLDKKNGSKETTLLSAPAPKDNGCPDGRKQSQETSPKTSQAEDGAQSKLETHRDPGRKDSETHGNRVQSFEG